MEDAGASAGKLIFVDTSAFKAYYDKKDKHHRVARKFVEVASGGIRVSTLCDKGLCPR